MKNNIRQIVFSNLEYIIEYIKENKKKNHLKFAYIFEVYIIKLWR